jgi:hypothetical protein
MTPEHAIWIGLAINLAGVMLMIGGRNQIIRDNSKRLDHQQREIESLKRHKLEVEDYRRERDEFLQEYRDRNKHVDGEFRTDRGRLEHIERSGWSGGRR